MNEAAGHLSNVLVSLDHSLEREFEAAVAAAADLAVRVACGVLRRREDAEEVAQEAFARAYRSFASLRQPEQFRGWIVRVTWRLAIDRWRTDRRRQACDDKLARRGRGSPRRVRAPSWGPAGALRVGAAPTRSTFRGHKQQKVERVKIRSGRAPWSCPRRAPPGPPLRAGPARCGRRRCEGCRGRRGSRW